jgi:hypothetical protein
MSTGVPMTPEEGETLVMAGVWARAEGRKPDAPRRKKQNPTRNLTARLKLRTFFVTFSFPWKVE